MRYFFHIRDQGYFRDPDGLDLSGPESVRKVAEETARTLMIQQIQGGALDLDHRIEVEDDQGRLVHILRFGDAIHIRGGR